MSTHELDAKVRELRELRNFESEIKAAISLVEDAIKADMLAKNTDTLYGCDCMVTWKTVTSRRFDSAAFKLTHPATDTENSEKVTLGDLLNQNVGKTLTNDEFQPLRQAIIYNALKKTDSYIAPKRRPKASASSLNPMLVKLGLPYTVNKAKKLWTITPTIPPATE